jgi:MerR family transcriptional regulator, light-induced transcriptional regulator
MQPSFSIGGVAIETGINKETLRKWELRYGFPMPARDSEGRRVYPAEQVAQLTEMKRLIDGGMRPAQVMDAWQHATPAITADARPDDPGSSRVVSQAMDALGNHRLSEFRSLLERDLTSRGLRPFIEDTATRLNWAVGEAWSNGSLRVFEEHLYSATLHDLLKQRSRCLSMSNGQPRILLSTPPGELHTLGLAMVNACFMEAGASCIYLDAQTPLTELDAAVRALDIQVVALSISACYPQRRVAEILQQLRALLPSTCQLWAGGAGVGHIPPNLDGVRVFASIGMALNALEELQQHIAAFSVQH